jgi:starch phosphorylase
MFSDKESFKRAFLERLETMLGQTAEHATPMDSYITLGSMIRDYIGKNWLSTNTQYRDKQIKQVYYFSLEFLPGKFLSNNLLNLGLWELCREGLAELGIQLEELETLEPDAGLGNGGLGRLASCFLDSLAAMQLPGHGCGIRYRYGLFQQKIVNGYQVELPDYWLKEGNVWEIRRSDREVEVRFGGAVHVRQVAGRLTFDHEDYESVLAIPYDVPIIGYKNNTVNTLRLWSAEPSYKDFDYQSLLGQDYHQMLAYKQSVEEISEFLYPDDSSFEGKVLRLKQQYFLVSAGLQSIVRSYKKAKGNSIHQFHEKVAIHINDTHPALAIPELMRILMDVEGLGWDEAWRITTHAISYTNHTIMGEALEKWSVDLLRPLLPRIYMIIEEINERFCRDLWNKYPGDWQRIAEMAVIADGMVKMAHLAIVGSHSVNGVSKIHTEILKKHVMKHFYAFTPKKFNNKTNGITHRRWLIKANPALAALISEVISSSWETHPPDLVNLLAYARDPVVQERVYQIKQQNKVKLAKRIQEKTGYSVDPSAIFDVQVKRLHAYKRQLLNVLHILDLYNRLRENPDLDVLPRVFLFSAKAAPSYVFAKTVIKLIHSVASVINRDATIRDKLKVIFLENYSVSLAELIIPAADVSEQISTASKEASGTGNMKLMMNGALTIGTLDGANIEMMEAVGKEHIFTFGMTADEVLHDSQSGNYRARDVYDRDPRLRRVLDQLVNGFLGEKREFSLLYHSLLTHNDEFFVLKDFASYADAQERVDRAFRNRSKWQESSLINIAHSGKFASDQTISEYASEIWNLKPAML